MFMSIPVLGNSGSTGLSLNIVSITSPSSAINIGNAKNEKEKFQKFHIEICINDKEKEFKLMAKDNLTREVKKLKTKL